MKKTQVISVIVALAAVGVLYFVPTKGKTAQEDVELNAHNEEHDHSGVDSIHNHQHSSLDQKVEDAVTMIQAGGPPMQAIQMLKSVLEEDPNHLGALRQLGFYSMQTNQFEKAISRFEKIVEVNPEEVIAYYMVGQAYEGLGNKDEAVKAYQKYAEIETDESKISAVLERIKEINNN